MNVCMSNPCINNGTCIANNNNNGWTCQCLPGKNFIFYNFFNELIINKQKITITKDSLDQDVVFNYWLALVLHAKMVVFVLIM
jgi:hypothetical protein